MSTRHIPLLLLLTMQPAGAAAHGVTHTVQGTEAVMITVSHDDGSPLVGAFFKVTSPSDAEPVLTGTTDTVGRLTFLPDHDGDWRVEVWTTDGHGFKTTIPWSAAAGLDSKPSAPATGFRLLVGVAVAGIAGYFTGRSRRRP